MLNPANLFAPKNQSYAPPIRTSTSISIDRLHETKKSRWDQPLTIPSVLYSKFKVPVPENVNNKQTKSYSNSLIDYIKRSYDRCKDDSQRKLMEIQLRKLIASVKVHQIQWQNYPLPNLSDNRPKANYQPPQVSINKKGTTKFPPGYNIADQPSKAKVMAQKRLEKLQEKLKKQDNEPEEKQQKSMFIGFKSQPPPRPKIQKVIPLTSILPGKILNAQQKLEFKKIEESKKVDKRKEKEREREKQKQKEKEKEKEKKLSKAKTPKINKKDLTIIDKAQIQDQSEARMITKRYLEFNKIKQANNQKNLTMDNDAQYEEDIAEMIIGRSKSIEKPYLRITGRPNPETIRPQPILKKALKHFLDQYKKGKSYDYLIDQFRSIRQDLTVQGIKNSLTVQVYQENLKISLFERDSTQFKHCQTTLWQLYRQGLMHSLESRNKFIGYQMITLIMQEKFEDLQFMLVEMPEGCHETREVQESLKLKRIFLLGNYRGFFDFYSERDQVCRCLLNQYIDKVRIKCLLMVCKTFGEKIKLSVLANTIGQDEDLLQAMICKEGGTIENGDFNLKASYDMLIKSEHLASKKVSILFN